MDDVAAEAVRTASIADWGSFMMFVLIVIFVVVLIDCDESLQLAIAGEE